MTSVNIESDEKYSATSVDQNQQVGGGFMSWLFGSEKGEYGTQLAMNAFNDDKHDVGCYIIEKSLDDQICLNYGCKGMKGRTLLHWMAISNSPSDLFERVLRNTDAKNYLNEQDDVGNTCVHYALMKKNSSLLGKLYDHGADLTIANDEGYCVRKRPKPSEQSEQITIHVERTVEPSAPPLHVSDIFAKTNMNTNSNEKTISDLVSELRQSSDLKLSSETLNFNMNTETDAMKPRKNQMKGGGRKKKGTRKMITYSEFSVDSPDSDDYFEEGDANTSDMIDSVTKVIESKRKDLHDVAVKRIEEIMKVDYNQAKAMKSILWNSIKSELPQLSNYDKSVELEKRASDKDVLKKIKQSDINSMLDILKQKEIERASSSTDTPKKNGSDKKSKKETKKSSDKKETKKKSKKEMGDILSISTNSSSIESFSGLYTATAM